jgi:hypothetical protein
VNKFLDIDDLPKLNQEYRNNLIRSITSNEIGAVINLPTHKILRPEISTAEFYQTSKEKSTTMHKPFHKIEREGMLIL